MCRARAGHRGEQRRCAQTPKSVGITFSKFDWVLLMLPHMRRGWMAVKHWIQRNPKVHLKVLDFQNYPRLPWFHRFWTLLVCGNILSTPQKDRGFGKNNSANRCFVLERDTCPYVWMHHRAKTQFWQNREVVTGTPDVTTLEWRAYPFRGNLITSTLSTVARAPTVVGGRRQARRRRNPGFWSFKIVQINPNFHYSARILE